MACEVLKIAIIGYGLRGQCYGRCVKNHPELAQVVAVADVDPDKVAAARETFGLSGGQCYSSAADLLAQPKLADAVFLCTQDRQHVPMGLTALERGYHVMMEKPISPELSECLAIREKAHACGKHVAVCHVLRYSPFYQKVKEVITSGRLGRVYHLSAVEDVGYFHQAHSFVRGNWRNSAETSPMILAKSCHDMDLIQWLMGEKCISLSSVGALSHFRADQAPEGAALRCLDGCKCKESCPYDAEKIYITNPGTGVRSNGGAWPGTAVVLEPTEENLYEALRTGPYGRCVYHCDNDVVDHQAVAMEFEDGATADFTMTAFTRVPGRRIRVMGTLGLLEGDASKGVVEVTEFGKPTEEIPTFANRAAGEGHSGGDQPLVLDFLKVIQGGGGQNLTSIDASVHSHVMALAAEASRLAHGARVALAEFEAGTAKR